MFTNGEHEDMVNMKSPSYSEKAERAFQQHETVNKLLNKKDIQDNIYIKNRLKALVKTKEMVSGKKD